MATQDVDREVRQDVAEVLVRYATGIDRRDWALFRTCFTDDCEADYGEIGVWHGVEEITDWMTVVHEACGPTLHRITNIAVVPGEGGGVTARSYVEALVLGPDNGAGVRASARLAAVRTCSWSSTEVKKGMTFSGWPGQSP